MDRTLFFLAQTQAPDPEGIYDIIVPEAERPLWPFLVYLALALLLVAGLVWLVLFLLKGRGTRGPVATPGLLAQREFEAIERGREVLTPNAFALAVSETLKNYLAERFRDRVRYETTEEFLTRLSREGTRLPPAAQQELRDFLTSSEEVKFGHRSDASDWCPPLLKRARQLVSLCEAVSVPDGKGNA